VSLSELTYFVKLNRGVFQQLNHPWLSDGTSVVRAVVPDKSGGLNRRFLEKPEIDPSEIPTCTQIFPSEILPLTHRAVNGENVGMSKGIVEETVYVFLFRCEKCNRPIWR
jgi:hypothetical protein